MKKGTVTSAADEWLYVVNGKEPDYMPDYQKIEGTPLLRRRIVNENHLKDEDKTDLTKPEIIGLALYTGPMVRQSITAYFLTSLIGQFMVYNAILRHQSNISRSVAQGEDYAKKQVALARHFIDVRRNGGQQATEGTPQMIKPLELSRTRSRTCSVYSVTDTNSLWAMYKSAEMLKLMVFDKIDVDGDLSICRKELGQHIYSLMKSGTLTSA